MKWLIVAGLEWLCTLVRHHPYPCKLAIWSYELDEKWKTGFWK